MRKNVNKCNSKGLYYLIYVLGYSAMPPTAFVFMGNFMASTSENGPQKTKLFKDLFKSLGDVLIEYKDLLTQSKFIFVPGPNDPGFSNIFPRPPLPGRILFSFVYFIKININIKNNAEI